MPQLCSDRSRSYPGRPAQQAVQLTLDSVLHGNMPDDQAGVSRGHNSSAKRDEGPNPEKGKGPTGSTIATNPTGGANGRRVADKPDPDEHLLERILSRSNMTKAWERVKANKGAPGIDKMPVADFMVFARERWGEIRTSLFAGTYQPLPVKRVEILKPTGGTRPLGIPTVLDRLIQQAIAQVLLPIFDPGFSEASFGFRPGRSAHNAVYRVRDFIRKGFRVAVDADLSKFFDTVDHDVLMDRVSRKGGTLLHDHRQRGWMGYFGIAEYYRPIPGIDHWLRRRVRMCYLKRWRRCRTKVRELTKLGCNLWLAISIGLRRKDPYRLAKTLVTQLGMTNQWLKDQGLLSVKELWVNIHYPATAGELMGTAWCGPACQVVWGGGGKSSPLPDSAFCR